MTDKTLDSLLKKQDIKLSPAFNDSIFTQLKEGDSNLNKMFSEDKLKLNSAFNDNVLDEARINLFFEKETIGLNDSFCDNLFKKLEEECPAPKINLWSIVRNLSGVAALFLAGIFIANEYFAQDAELLPSDSRIYAIAKENINTEIDYFLLQDEMDELSNEIDILEASLLEINTYTAIVEA